MQDPSGTYTNGSTTPAGSPGAPDAVHQAFATHAADQTTPHQAPATPPAAEGAPPPAPAMESTQPAPPADHAADEAGLAHAAAELDQVESALARLEAGTLDNCDVCGEPIGRARLLEDPLLTRCPEHTQPAEHANNAQPVEDGPTATA